MSINFSNIELAELQADALYVYDASGRLLRVNEPDPDGPAPRFFLSRTSAGNLWRVRYDLPASLVTALARLTADEPVASELQELPYHIAEYQELLGQYAPISKVYAGPSYYLPELAQGEHPPPLQSVTITPENATLLQANYPYTLSHIAEHQPVVVMVADGMAVAACSSARITAQVAEASVHTIETYRGCGYAAEAVRGWAAALRATGRLPLYSTWWENIASQAVAKKLRAVQYGVWFSIT